MQNFTFHNPTKIIFGKGTIPQIGAEAAVYGKKALFLYGKNSIKTNGVYDQATQSLNESGIEIIEFGGVKANPVLTHAREAVAVGRDNNVDFVVAVGGGSVLDEAKGVAASIASGADIWDLYMKTTPVEKALPIVTVLTMAATGSEMNGGTVLTNEDTKVKIGLAHPLLYPKTSILDPETLYTIPAEQTAYGAVDAITHLLESYLTGEDRFTPLQDRYVEGIIRTLIEITPDMIKNPQDYDMRATFMWAATLAWNGIAPCGVGQWNTPNHLIGHSMSSHFDTPHGASLSITLGGYLPFYAQTKSERIDQIGERVFDISGSRSVEKTVSALKSWFAHIGSPTTLKQIGVDDEGFEAIVKNAAECAPLWGMPHMTYDVIKDILLRVRG